MLDKYIKTKDFEPPYKLTEETTTENVIKDKNGLVVCIVSDFIEDAEETFKQFFEPLNKTED